MPAIEDLSQLRWLHIRTVEGYQELENQNLELRKQLNLQKQNQLNCCDEQTAALAKIATILVKWLSDNHKELLQAKEWVHSEKMAVDEILGRANEALDATRKKADGLDFELGAYKKHNDELNTQLEDAYSKIHMLEEASLRVDTGAEARIKELEEELDDVRVDRSTLRETKLELEDKLASAMEELSHLRELAPGIASAEEKIITLRGELLELRQSAESAELSVHQTLVSFQGLVDDRLRFLNSEMEAQANVINERDARIQELLEQLGDKKNNFAKFVDLKRENKTLKKRVSRMADGNTTSNRRASSSGNNVKHRAGEMEPTAPFSSRQREKYYFVEVAGAGAGAGAGDGDGNEEAKVAPPSSGFYSSAPGQSKGQAGTGRGGLRLAPNQAVGELPVSARSAAPPGGREILPSLQSQQQQQQQQQQQHIHQQYHQSTAGVFPAKRPHLF
jgi:hypothetical protein